MWTYLLAKLWFVSLMRNTFCSILPFENWIKSKILHSLMLVGIELAASFSWASYSNLTVVSLVTSWNNLVSKNLELSLICWEFWVWSFSQNFCSILAHREDGLTSLLSADGCSRGKLLIWRLNIWRYLSFTKSIFWSEIMIRDSSRFSRIKVRCCCCSWKLLIWSTMFIFWRVR